MMTTEVVPAPRPSGGQLAPVHEAHASRRSADALRAEYLQSVTAGMITIHDVIESATSEQSRPLLKITIRQLLLAQEGWGEARTGECLRKVCLMTSTTLTRSRVGRLDLGWLMDPRARGTRLVAFLDASLAPAVATPWPGFPFHPAPACALPQGAQS